MNKGDKRGMTKKTRMQREDENKDKDKGQQPVRTVREEDKDNTIKKRTGRIIQKEDNRKIKERTMDNKGG